MPRSNPGEKRPLFKGEHIRELYQSLLLTQAAHQGFMDLPFEMIAPFMNDFNLLAIAPNAWEAGKLKEQKLIELASENEIYPVIKYLNSRKFSNTGNVYGRIKKGDLEEAFVEQTNPYNIGLAARLKNMPKDQQRMFCKKLLEERSDITYPYTNDKTEEFLTKYYAHQTAHDMNQLPRFSDPKYIREDTQITLL